MARYYPPSEKLHQLFLYEPDTGRLLWRETGARAGTSRKGIGRPKKSRRVMIFYEFYEESHVVWCMMTGSWPTQTIDHINRDAGDNRWLNLRELTTQQQSLNKGTYRNNTSGIPGVWWRESAKKWRAYIRIEGRLIHLGHFSKIEDAIVARKIAEAKYHEPLLEGTGTLQ